jgi:hypothetical protein
VPVLASRQNKLFGRTVQLPRKKVRDGEGAIASTRGRVRSPDASCAPVIRFHRIERGSADDSRAERCDFQLRCAPA